MPLYEYECEACGHQLEVQQKLADAPLTKCPECGKKKLQKLISATSFTLKGGGWYKDLYASSKPGETKSEASAETKSEAKADAKVEAKADAKPAKADKPAPSTGGKDSSAGKKKPAAASK